MNRIILIGNGFDLAHGMATSYKSFIDDYWNSILCEIRIKKEQIFKNTDVIISNLNKIPVNIDYKTFLSEFSNHIKFKNYFLKQITDKQNIQNWVDIEDEYYKQVIRLSKKTKDFNYPEGIESLNSNFNQITSLLNKYLKKVEKEKTTKKDIIEKHIYSYIKYRDINEKGKKQILEKEYKRLSLLIGETENDGYEEINGLFKSVKGCSKDDYLVGKLLRSPPFELKKDISLLFEDHNDNFKLLPTETLFLNFNYTTTELNYSSPPLGKKPYPEIIHIHGNLKSSEKNPIIFGYGDEIDSNYIEIENLNDNRYLENMKSIKYLEKDNYKKTLEFVNSDLYQVFIFGHSCGISDRTLLNTLFEHKNCTSVKPFYHKKKDNTDNYSDIVRNISRNFNNKSTMRDIVVNKEYCKPLS